MAGLALLGEIADVDGVDAVFIGPADLAASMGKLGQPEHPDVVTTIENALATIVEHGKRAGVNAFNESIGTPLHRRPARASCCGSGRGTAGPRCRRAGREVPQRR